MNSAAWFGERGLLPDWLVRVGIRRLLKARLREEARGGVEQQHGWFRGWLEELRRSPIASHTQDANDQHYEVPVALYEMTLGKHLKYSSGYWSSDRPGDASDLDQAEARMLELYMERAQLEDGMRVLDLGCGWGSLSLWIAERYPNCSVLSVSNSASQREFIERRCLELGHSNVTVVTCDANEFEPDQQFDRVMSVEMFEHMRNHEALLARIAHMLAPGGKLFVHIFTHRDFSYPFETSGEDDWMGQNFFTGGQMPSDRQLLYFQKDLLLEDHWRLSGRHYGQTAEAWLTRFDAHRRQLDPVLKDTYGPAARRMKVYWRWFFMACAELWNFRKGDEWFVSHYLFRARP